MKAIGRVELIPKIYDNNKIKCSGKKPNALKQVAIFNHLGLSRNSGLYCFENSNVSGIINRSSTKNIDIYLNCYSSYKFDCYIGCRSNTWRSYT